MSPGSTPKSQPGATVHVASPTEGRNPATVDIDRLPTLEVLRLINAEDARVAGAVSAVLPAVAAVVDLAVATLRAGGRVHYVGAGTSGRIAVLDAVEVAPSYGLPPGTFVAHHAGGLPAFGRPLEDVEDDEAAGAADLAGTAAGDLVVGLSASGRSPYVVGALHQAERAGARSVLISGDPTAALGRAVDVHVAVATGPEAVTGSTRMKAGTAQKMVLNAVSTATMVRLGRTYSNLMVGVVATNDKLRGRALSVLVEASGAAAELCAATLADAGGEVAVALVSLLRGVPVAQARTLLADAGGEVSAAVRR